MNASLELCISPEYTIQVNDNESIKFEIPIPLVCPQCAATDEQVGTWGYYNTLSGEIRRYMCKTCVKSFNPAKLPFFKENQTDLIYRLAHLTIKDQLSVNSLAQEYNIPESTLRRLITEIKTFLADNYERAKQLYERANLGTKKNNGNLRVLFYDEGFLKILGKTGYLIFTLNSEGKPITLAVETRRDGETIYNHFLAAVTQMGGIDIIIGDGAPAIVAATKALKMDVILVRQIHSGKAKRAVVHKYVTIPNMKAMYDISMELHTGSLLPNTESKITVKKKIFYPPSYSQNKKKKSGKTRNKNTSNVTIKREGTLTPVEGANRKKKCKTRKPKLLAGHQVFLRTTETLFINELNFIPFESNINSPDCPFLIEIEEMISLVQAALPNQFITSNRAEVFNAQYDRKNKSWGVTTIKIADIHAKAWAVMTFYPEEARKLIQQHEFNVTYSLLRNIGFLIISKMEVH